jgi:hypothetical protein
MASSRHCINPACSMIATRLAAVVSELRQRCRRIRHFLGNPLSHNPVPVYLNRQSVVLVTQFESRLPQTAVVSGFSRTAVCGAVLLGASEPLIVESNVRVSLSDCYAALEVRDQILDSPAPVITSYDPGQSDPDDFLLGMDLDDSLRRYGSDRVRLVERLRQFNCRRVIGTERPIMASTATTPSSSCFVISPCPTRG